MNPPNSISKKGSVYSLIRQYSKSGILLSKINILNLLTETCSFYELDIALRELQKDNLLSCHDAELYFATESKDNFQKGDFLLSHAKIDKVKAPLDLLARIGTIKFIGITGSSTFDMVGEKDDLDIFVIAQKNMLFITRLAIFVVTFIFGNFKTSRSKKTKDTVCANVILEEGNLIVPYPKRNLFSARELVLYKPFYDKENMLDKLKNANIDWFHALLPNQDHKLRTFSSQAKKGKEAEVLQKINNVLAFLQLWYMKSKVTNELISQKQLWLHPNTRRKLH